VYEGSQEKQGEYAAIFEDEYKAHLNEVLTLQPSEYNEYLKRIEPGRTHEGYFSIDKKSKRLVDPDVGARSAERTSDDVDAYDLILRRKAQLLSFEEPVRFIFAHSALREGWDNPNVFVIGMLKKADPANVTSRRQEVGRGLRLCANQRGDRMDDPATVHDLNVLTVIAAEGYKEFVAGLQKEIAEAISARPRKADVDYFVGKVLQTEAGDVQVTPAMAKAITRYLIKNDYTDDDDKITAGYHDAKTAGTIAPLPPELAAYSVQILKLIDSVFSDAQIPLPEDDRKTKRNHLNSNFHKAEFQALWNRIHQKAVYAVQFDSGELTGKCTAVLDAELRVAPLQYVVQRGEQLTDVTYDRLQAGDGFELQETQTASLKSSVHSAVKYDLIGKLADETALTRDTIGRILGGIKPSVFANYQINPEDFLRNAARLINEQKATVVVEHLTYSAVDEAYGVDIFTEEKLPTDSGRAVKTSHHIFDYVFTDSKNEREFVALLDSGTEIEVYAKLPKAFSIPTPVGGYTPDWAIAFKQGTLRHVYFVAETKGSMSSMEFRKIEETKIECAQKFFSRITSEQVKYGVVNSYAKLMELVQQ